MLGLNQAAQALPASTVGLAIVPDATHLFGEPGALDRLARLAGDWFAKHW